MADDPHFLEGIPEPGEPLESIEDWVSVLRAPEIEAHLARGFLETQGFEPMIYPIEGSTGFEQFGHPGVAEAITGEPAAAGRGPIHVLVPPDQAEDALEALRELRDRPELAGGEALDEGGTQGEPDR